MNRRKLLQMIAGSAGGLLTKKVSAQICTEPTKPQTEGPFYPNDWSDYEVDADMTKLIGSNELASGQLTIIKGQVIDSKTCKPLAGVRVDVWQANAFGQYFHEKDAAKESLKDRNFQYRCRLTTDHHGQFSFKTIKPAPYPATQNWVRPPHIHYKIVSEKHEELITQMYFKGDPLNKLDRILQDMTENQQKNVSVDFTEKPSKVLEGEFIIALKPL